MKLNINGMEIDTEDKELRELLDEWWLSGECNYISFSLWLLGRYRNP